MAQKYVHDDTRVDEVVRVGRDLLSGRVDGLEDVHRPQDSREIDEERLVREVQAHADPVARRVGVSGQDNVMRRRELHTAGRTRT